MSDFAVVLAPQAESDIAEAFQWYLGRNATAADAFRTEALDAIDQLADSPTRWRLDVDGTRRRVLRHFPFSVVFEVLGTTVTVLAVCARSTPARLLAPVK